MGNFKNVEVFRDTVRLCSQDERLQESIRASVDGQKPDGDPPAKPGEKSE